MSIFTKILRAGEGKKVRALQSLVPDINALEPMLEALSDDEMASRTVTFREHLDHGEELNDLLVEAFATVREAARRTIGQRHFDVQLMGGAALHFGWIAEMKTGEGKTLVSTLPVYLNGLAGKGVHVVTVNDYLARRDAEWMGQIHRFLGITVGRVSPEIDDWQQKKDAYLCDVTYGTNTEFGFDYLRDNMARSLEHMVQRGHVYGIVDEVDSILIDEARTPLIISGPATDSVRLYYQFAGIARTLSRQTDYEVDEEKRQVAPTEAGIDKVERQLGVDNLYDLVASNLVHQLTQALRAKELYRRDKDYIVADGEVKIVDEFTGRVLEGRRWSDGLHQAVEAKERVKIKEENHTWATVTLQNYFRLYTKLSGMTGTAETEASEFAGTYNLPVVPIPTNTPLIRADGADLIYKTELAKFEAVIDDLVERYDEGQPVLVGTASVEKSEVLSAMLDKRGIPHTVLNAKQHVREAGIVAQAGRLHAITVATNMAGRGVDILLGGNPEALAAQEVQASGLVLESEEGQGRFLELVSKFEEECKAEGEKIRELGGLYVLGSERHESRRIDNQLRGRSGRQGDPGESRFYLSLEDELMRLFATGAMNWVMNEQRKVIYARRRQILDGEDLRSRTMEVISSALESIVGANCLTEFNEDWDIEALLREVRVYYPTAFAVEDLAEASTTPQLLESLLAEAVAYYEGREESMPGGEDTMRALEREVMLQIIDQKWREHLSEMDYLREGINLRAMGQQDPLVAWQREGYEMFGQLMSGIDDDYVKIVMHAQVQVLEQSSPDESAELARAQYLAADDPVQGSHAVQRAMAAGPAPGEEIVLAPDPAAAAPSSSGAASGGAGVGVDADEVQAPIVKDSVYDRVGRNDACPCGSGKKFKFCHGR